jgi:Acetyltransferases, including N-acetylases of ribosomal proteins
MQVREVRLADAEKLSTLILQIDHDSKFMLWNSGERALTSEAQIKMIESFLNRTNSTILVAEENEELVGYLLANGGQAEKNKHSAYIVIGVNQTHRGKGIGTLLFQAVDVWALNHNLHRLELTVVTANEGAVALYKKQGFEIEGTKKIHYSSKINFMMNIIWRKFISKLK